MKTLNVLLGCAERRVSNPIEVLLHDICFDYAALNCISAARVDELMRKGSMQSVDLIIVAADNLLGLRGRFGCQVEEVVSAVQTIKSRVATPMIVVASIDDELRFIEAGAEAVVTLPLNDDRLRDILRQVLRIPEKVESSEPASGNLWWKRLQKVLTS